MKGIWKINSSEPQTQTREASWKGSVLSPIVLLCLNLFIFGAITVYLGNQGEFLVEDEDVLMVLLVPALGAMALLSLLSFPLSRLNRMATSAVLFFFAFVTYIHGNLLRWDTGVLDGAALETDALLPLLADLALWVVLGFLVWRFRRWLAIHGWKICLLLMVFQLLGAVDLKRNAKVGNLQLQEVPDELYAFHSGPNVVHIVLDGFQGNVFEELVKNDPGLRSELEGFVFFRDAMTTSAVTYLSLPATLSGKAYDNSTTITKYHDETLGENNLYSFLSGVGYDVDVASPVWWNLDRDYFSSYYRVPAPFASLEDTIRSTAWYLLDISLFRQMPYWLKSLVYRNGAWLFSSELAEHPEQQFQHFAHLEFLADVTAKANTERPSPTYKLFHLITPHAPLVSQPDCSYSGREMDATFEVFSDQSRCTVRGIRKFLARLRELGIYDEALIMIHGDHGGGVAFDMTAKDGSKTSSTEVLPGMWGNPLPLLMVKPPGSNAPFQTSNRFVSLSDLPATVSGVLGENNHFPGQSIFLEGEGHSRRMYYSSSQHRNDAAEKGRFSDFTSFAVTGSIFDAGAWAQVDHFELSSSDLSGRYTWGTPLTFGRSGSFKPFGDGGWTVTRGSEINWTQGKETGLLLPVDGSDRDVRVRFKVRPMLVKGVLDRQRVAVKVNGRLLTEMELTEGRFKTHELTIPSEMIEDDQISLKFLLPDAASPRSLGSGEDDRELALAFLQIQFDPID